MQQAQRESRSMPSSNSDSTQNSPRNSNAVAAKKDVR
jgi:hypothetical protein